MALEGWGEGEGDAAVNSVRERLRLYLVWSGNVKVWGMGERSVDWNCFDAYCRTLSAGDGGGGEEVDDQSDGGRLWHPLD